MSRRTEILALLEEAESLEKSGCWISVMDRLFRAQKLLEEMFNEAWLAHHKSSTIQPSKGEAK